MMTTPRMTPRVSPRAFDQTQQYLLSHAKTFVTYLQQASASLNHLGEFINNDDIGRLFFENNKLTSVKPATLDAITSALGHPLLLQHFEKRLLFWQPVFSADGITSARAYFLADYFVPIKQSTDYQTFTNEQVINIKSSGNIENDIDSIIQDIHNLIGGAILFRVASEWRRHNPYTHTEKLALLTKVLNCSSDAANVCKQLRLALENHIDHLLISLQLLTKKKKNKEKIGDSLINTLTQIHDHLLFKGFKDEAYIVLAAKLSVFIENHALYRDHYVSALMKFYNVNFDETNKGLKELVKTICPFSSPSMLKKYQNIAKFIEAEKYYSSTHPRSISEPTFSKSASVSITPAVPTRSRTASTPPAKLSNNAIPSLDLSAVPPAEQPSIPTARESPGRIYPKRTQMMRRRISSATLYSPRAIEKNNNASNTGAATDDTHAKTIGLSKNKE